MNNPVHIYAVYKYTIIMPLHSVYCWVTLAHNTVIWPENIDVHININNVNTYMTCGHTASFWSSYIIKLQKITKQSVIPILLAEML